MFSSKGLGAVGPHRSSEPSVRGKQLKTEPTVGETTSYLGSTLHATLPIRQSQADNVSDRQGRGGHYLHSRPNPPGTARWRLRLRESDLYDVAAFVSTVSMIEIERAGRPDGRSRVSVLSSIQRSYGSVGFFGFFS